MKGAVLALLAVTLAALIAPPAAAQDIWQEQQVTSSFATWRGGAKVWGDTVYYGQATSSDLMSSVYRWTQAQGSTLLIGGDGISRAPGAVWGDNLVVSRVEGGQRKLYLYGPGSGEVPIATSAGNKERSDIYQNTIVWEDYRTGSARVYIWDPVNGERRVSLTETSQMAPKVWGNRVIWQEGANVRMWTREGGVSTIMQGQTTGGALYSAIYQDRVVIWQNAWTEYPPGLPAESHPGFLKEWTPQNGLRTILQHDRTTSALEIWESLVVLSTGAWDPANGFTYYIEPGHYVNSYSLYGNQVAWVSGDNNIHLSAMVPEPSSLLALIGALGVLGAMTSMRRKGERR